MPRFLKDNQYYIDLEDRALFLTITNQRYGLDLSEELLVKLR
jgi:hypothetical protein